MSHLKNALLDLELSQDTLNYRREELAEFVAANTYTRGGPYPKYIRALKMAVAQSIIQTHACLYRLGLTDQPVRAVKVSRKTTIYSAS